MNSTRNKIMNLKIERRFVIFRVIFLAIIFVIPSISSAEKKVPLKYDRATLEKKWEDRINGFLKDGIIPLIDLESSLAKGFGGKEILERYHTNYGQGGGSAYSIFYLSSTKRK
jgi:hypothetical protein